MFLSAGTKQAKRAVIWYSTHSFTTEQRQQEDLCTIRLCSWENKASKEKSCLARAKLLYLCIEQLQYSHYRHSKPYLVPKQNRKRVWQAKISMLFQSINTKKRASVLPTKEPNSCTVHVYSSARGSHRLVSIDLETLSPTSLPLSPLQGSELDTKRKSTYWNHLHVFVELLKW